MGERQLYQVVKEILEKNPETRSSDKILLWKVWEGQKLTHFGGANCMHMDRFIKDAVTPESITRVRRAIQASHKQLQASEAVKKMRKNVVVRDKYTKVVPVYNYDNNTVYFEN